MRLYGRTRDDVRRKLTKVLEQADQGIPVAAESWTLAQYLTYWLEHVVQPERKPRTVQGYESVIRLYLVPELGKTRLGKLAVRDVRSFINRVRAQCLCCKHGVDAARDVPRCCVPKGGECCESHPSVRMVQSIHAVLRNALESLGLRRGELLGLRWEDVTLVGCRACAGEGGEIDGEECHTCAGSGVESATR
ncbi:hypothetical protein ACQP1W_50000 [Spirillospora sp. CA-255316]